jgi:hypothetical protein
MTATTTRPLDYEEQLRRESDLLDWKRADRRYQERVERGESLDAEQITDWHFCMAMITQSWLAEAGLA